MKKIKLLFGIVLFLISVPMFGQIDTTYRLSSYRLNKNILKEYVPVNNVSPSFAEYKAFKEYTLQTKLLVVGVNVVGATILLHKYSWTKQTQRIVTPIIFCAIIPITFYKTIEWNRFKHKIYNYEK